jgi:hypothetical protein
MRDKLRLFNELNKNVMHDESQTLFKKSSSRLFTSAGRASPPAPLGIGDRMICGPIGRGLGARGVLRPARRFKNALLPGFSEQLP